LALIGLLYICKHFLTIPDNQNSYIYFYGAATIGVIVSFLFVKITQYYTDYTYGPVQAIAKSSQMGHATNIITGLSVGLESTGLPVIVISIAIISSY
jgi:Na+/H+-translocating membrane pyrophosphatase